MVEGVNNNNSNAGLYAASGVVLGGGAGAATAYLTKPYLKNNAPTDTFETKMKENFAEKSEDVKTTNEKYSNLSKEVDGLADDAALKNFVKENGIKLKKGALKDKNLDEAKTIVKNSLDSALKDEIKEIVDKFDAKDAYKQFAENSADDTTKAIVKKAAKSIQGKYAMIYGICAGAALGVVGYLAGVMGGNKAEEAVEQPASANPEA